MALLVSPFIKPLHRAETSFLQVLLDRFSLSRRGEGSELRVHFEDDTEAIWDSHGKDHLRLHLLRKQRRVWQRKLDSFLLKRRGDHLEFKPRGPRDSGFVFRYASGGTLPIIRFRGSEYFSFFFRDIDPIGWNIANGSCDNRDELLDPFLAVERELREELLIADFTKNVRYVFEADRGKPIDRPEYAVARHFWKRRHPTKDLSMLQEKVIRIEWIDGPDSLSVQIGDSRPAVREGCFVNINGDDFGIEIDRVARIHVSDGAVLCDGEIEGPQLLNSPVGVFEVERFRRQLRKGPPFIPDFFFFDTWEFDGSRLDSVVNGDFFRDLKRIRTAKELAAFRNCRNRFELCPVTSRIVRRYFQTAAALPQRAKPPAATQDPPEVFISYSHKDRKWLADLETHLKPHLREGAFRAWSDRELAPGAKFEEEIRKALARARAAVLLVTPNFLASDFIHENELTPLLKENEQRGLKILWIPVEASAYEQTKLKDHQALHDTATPLAEMKAKRTRVWMEISRAIKEAVS